MSDETHRPGLHRALDVAEALLWVGLLVLGGLVAQAWLWPQPNRFLLRGEPAYAQPHLELAIGLGLENLAQRAVAGDGSDADGDDGHADF